MIDVYINNKMFSGEFMGFKDCNYLNKTAGYLIYFMQYLQSSLPNELKIKHFSAGTDDLYVSLVVEVYQ